MPHAIGTIDASSIVPTCSEKHEEVRTYSTNSRFKIHNTSRLTSHWAPRLRRGQSKAPRRRPECQALTNPNGVPVPTHRHVSADSSAETSATVRASASPCHREQDVTIAKSGKGALACRETLHVAPDASEADAFGSNEAVRRPLKVGPRCRSRRKLHTGVLQLSRQIGQYT